MGTDAVISGFVSADAMLHCIGDLGTYLFCIVFFVKIADVDCLTRAGAIPQLLSRGNGVNPLVHTVPNRTPP